MSATVPLEMGAKSPPLPVGNSPRESSVSASAGFSLLSSGLSTSSLIRATLFFFFFFLLKSIAVSSTSFLSVSVLGAAIFPLRAVVGMDSVSVATQWETAAITAAEATAGQPAFCERFTYALRLSAHEELFCPGRC